MLIFSEQHDHTIMISRYLLRFFQSVFCASSALYMYRYSTSEPCCLGVLKVDLFSSGASLSVHNLADIMFVKKLSFINKGLRHWWSAKICKRWYACSRPVLKSWKGFHGSFDIHLLQQSKYEYAVGHHGFARIIG